METVQDNAEQDARSRRVRLFAGQLSWRMLLVRLVVNGLTLIVMAVLVPNIYFIDKTFVTLLLMALGLGLLNAFVKPIIQLVTLPFIFATYGFAIVVINTVVLLLLDFVFEERFYVGSLAAALAGGLVMGAVASLLESLLGLNLPIVTTAQGVDSLPSSGTMSITNVLVDEVIGDGGVQPDLNEDASEPAPVGDDNEPVMAAMVGMGEEAGVATAHEETAVTGGHDKVEPPDNTDDEQSGDVK